MPAFASCPDRSPRKTFTYICKHAAGGAGARQRRSRRLMVHVALENEVLFPRVLWAELRQVSAETRNTPGRWSDSGPHER